MAYLENAPELPPPTREAVVSPSQSAFGLRAYEEEGEDGEGEAPSEVEEEDFEEADIGEDDWDTVRTPASMVTVSTLIGLHSRFGDKLLRNWLVCPHNGTAVLTALE